MRLSSTLQFSLLATGALLVACEAWRHLRQGRELAEVEARVQAGEQESESQRSALAAAEQRNQEVLEAERRAGNQTLLALMSERAAAAKSAASEPVSEARTFGNALAAVLDSSDQQQVERDYQRADMRANLEVFFKLTNLSPEKREQYIDLGIDTKRRDSDRTAALLRGSMSVADALNQRDEDRHQNEIRRREILGPEGEAFFESVGDGMRNDESKRLVGAIRQNMGTEPLSQEQSDKLQALIKTEISAPSFDNTDLFRPEEEWTQIVSDRQQNVVRGAAEFLSPSQTETLKTLVALDLAQRQQQREQQRKALGISNGM